MKQSSTVGYVAAAALFLVGAWGNASQAAATRVIFTVGGAPTCQGFFSTNPPTTEFKLQKTTLTDGPQNDGTLFVSTDFSDGKTQLLSWQSVGATPTTPPKPVNAIIIKTGSLTSGESQIVYYPDAVTSDFDAAPVSSNKAIIYVSFCYGGPVEQIGYEDCPLGNDPSTGPLYNACTAIAAGSNPPVSGTPFFFVIYNVKTLATGGSTLPASCACSGVNTRSCNPDPSKPDACRTAEPGEILQNATDQSLLATTGSCVVTICSTVLGKTRCQEKSIPDPCP